jgi:hypothetical protein
MVDGNAFSAFDFSEDETLEIIQESRLNPHGRDKAICICGHPRSRHVTELMGEVSGNAGCTPAKQVCSCVKIHVVGEASDTRLFLRKTTGPGKFHALAQGIAATNEREGATFDWSIDPVCFSCGDATKKVIPMMVTQRGAEVLGLDDLVNRRDTGYNVLICADCRSV